MHLNGWVLWLKVGLTISLFVIFIPLYGFMLWQYFHNKEKYQAKLKYIFFSISMLVFALLIIWLV